jgi:hypothetical protein
MRVGPIPVVVTVPVFGIKKLRFTKLCGLSRLLSAISKNSSEPQSLDFDPMGPFDQMEPNGLLTSNPTEIWLVDV